MSFSSELRSPHLDLQHETLMRLADLTVGTEASVTQVTGSGSFRRRLLELGILPGTRVELIGIAPLGDPLELLVRGSSLSIRRVDAAAVEVDAAESAARADEQRVFAREVLERSQR